MKISTLFKFLALVVVGFVIYFFYAAWCSREKEIPDTTYKLQLIDSLDIKIADRTKKLEILNNTIHWKQLEYMDLLKDTQNGK